MSVRELDVISVKEFMGHAKLETTQRYLHARARRTDADRLTRAFAGRTAGLAVPLNHEPVEPQALQL